MGFRAKGNTHVHPGTGAACEGGSYLTWESEKGFLGTKSEEDPRAPSAQSKGREGGREGRQNRGRGSQRVRALPQARGLDSMVPGMFFRLASFT